MTTFAAGTICPWCGARHALATGVSDENPPNDGDITLCVSCGEWAFFEAAAVGGLRKPTYAEYEPIAESPMLRAARGAWAETVGKGKARS